MVRFASMRTSTLSVSYPGARNSSRCRPAATFSPASDSRKSATVPTKYPSTKICAVSGSTSIRMLPSSVAGSPGGGISAYAGAKGEQSMSAAQIVVQDEPPYEYAGAQESRDTPKLRYPNPVANG